MALNSIEEVQTNPTLETANQITQLSNYNVSHPDSVTEYRRSGIILHIYSDASYISEPEAHIIPKIQKTNNINSPIKQSSTFGMHYNEKSMASATEAELVGLCQNCQNMASVQTVLSEMGHS